MSAPVGDKLVMMSVADGSYIALGGVGGRIWELLERPRDADELCRLLMAEFDVSEADCRSELDAFLADLGKHGAIAL